MSAMVAEAVDLLQKADDYEIKFVIEYLKQDNNDINTKKAALNRLVSMRKNHNLIFKRMKRIINFVIVTMFICLFGNLSFAEELIFAEKIGYVDPDSGDKLLDREIDDEFVKETYLCSDGSYSYRNNYKWELLEYQKLSKDKKFLCHSVKLCSSKERINGNYWVKKYRTSKDSDWVELQPGEVVVGSMDIGKLICHYYLIKTKYSERINEIPQDLLNKRKMKTSDVTPPKTFTLLQNAADKAEEKRIAESLAIEESIIDAELDANDKKKKQEIAKKFVEDNVDLFIAREAGNATFEYDEDIEREWLSYKYINKIKVKTPVERDLEMRESDIAEAKGKQKAFEAKLEIAEKELEEYYRQHPEAKD